MSGPSHGEDVAMNSPGDRLRAVVARRSRSASQPYEPYEPGQVRGERTIPEIADFPGTSRNLAMGQPTYGPVQNLPLQDQQSGLTAATGGSSKEFAFVTPECFSVQVVQGYKVQGTTQELLQAFSQAKAECQKYSAKCREQEQQMNKMFAMGQQAEAEIAVIQNVYNEAMQTMQTQEQRLQGSQQHLSLIHI